MLQTIRYINYAGILSTLVKEFAIYLKPERFSFTNLLLSVLVLKIKFSPIYICNLFDIKKNDIKRHDKTEDEMQKQNANHDVV